MELESKFRLTKEGEKIFGNGPCLLLETVRKLGSLSKAAKELNMSYSKAWSMINRSEKALGCLLIDTQIGGTGGGGSNLTPVAEYLIKAYRDFYKEAIYILDVLYRKYFEGF
ncbi:MAG: LysR family transcriptional regulator [Firmicutes bacterium]|nr:LysR family transcriptional regulator [Bacillota bacterium]